jgi:putative transcriptional regulator
MFDLEDTMGRAAFVQTSGYLTGQLLVAMPTMADPRFHRTVIYVCAHSAEGAMGLIVNKPLNDLRFTDILGQLKITPRSNSCSQIHVHRGGPVEVQRGFVLHTSDYQKTGTVVVNEDIALSATTEILKDIADGYGPNHNLMALGYSGWGPNQLDEEIKRNAWLCVPSDSGLLFSDGYDHKWDLALARLGIAAHRLSSEVGHA